MSAGTKDDKDKGGPGLTAEMRLRSHFSGKRTAQRSDLDLKITVCGVLENFPARTVDVSRTGLLLRITDDHFTDEQGDLASFAFNVQQHFKKGADILFGGHSFGVTAGVVRVTHRKVDGKPTLLLACRFKHALSDGQCDALGIVAAPRPRTRRK